MQSAVATGVSGFEIQAQSFEECLLVHGSFDLKLMQPFLADGYLILNMTSRQVQKANCRDGLYDSNGDCMCEDGQELLGPVENNTMYCEGCRDGTFSEDGEACRPCDEDFYCQSGKRYKCPPNAYSALGSSKKNDCTCLGGHTPKLRDGVLQACKSCALDASITTYFCQKEFKVYSVIGAPVVEYQNTFRNASTELTALLDNLWHIFTSEASSFVKARATSLHYDFAISPNGVRVQYTLNTTDSSAASISQRCNSSKAELVVEYDYYVGDMKPACKNERDACMKDIGILFDSHKKQCSVLLVGDSKLGFVCNNNQQITEGLVADKIENLQSKTDMYSYKLSSYDRCLKERVCHGLTHCDMLNATVLFDIDTMKKTEVEALIADLNDPDNDFAAHLLNSTYIDILTVGRVGYYGRQKTSCEDKIAGSRHDQGKCMCPAGFYENENKACAPCLSNHWCDQNKIFSCEHAVASNTEIKWSMEEECLCHAGYHKTNQTQACQLCSPGYFCPGWYETQQLQCPNGRPISGIGAKDEHGCISHEPDSVLRVTISMRGTGDCGSFEYTSVLSANTLRKVAQQQYQALSAETVSVVHRVRINMTAVGGSGKYTPNDFVPLLQTSEGINAPVTLDAIQVDGVLQSLKDSLEITVIDTRTPVLIEIDLSIHDKPQLDACLSLVGIENVMKALLEGSTYTFNSDKQLTIETSSSKITAIQAVFDLQIGNSMDATVANSANQISETIDPRRSNDYTVDLALIGVSKKRCAYYANVIGGMCVCRDGFQCMPSEHATLGCAANSQRSCVPDIENVAIKHEVLDSNLVAIFTTLYILYAVSTMLTFFYFLYLDSNLTRQKDAERLWLKKNF